MPPFTPEQLADLQIRIFAAYADLWGLCRGLIATLETSGVVLPEHFETAVMDWKIAHLEEVTMEARDRLTRLWP